MAATAVTEVRQAIEKTKEFIQTKFDGGMNLFLDDSLLADNEYGPAFNVRNRSGPLKPARNYVKLPGVPIGLKQGIYGFDFFTVLFSKGLAYYKLAGETTWRKIKGFKMSETAPIIWAQAVPASTVNYKRKLTTTGDIQGTNLDRKIKLEAVTVNGTPAAFVCQDGITQPYVIFPDGTARVTKEYGQWNDSDREYVPIGRQMAFVNGILFVAALDGMTILRSVSGRPLDFVINIDTDGNKGGDAYTTAYSVSYDTITCLGSLNSGQLFVGTTKGGYQVDITYETTYFGEPYFANKGGFASGIVNASAIVELLGDYAWIDFNGLRSFNAIQQEKNEGRNSVFSRNVASLFEEIYQETYKCCATVFDNYAIFAVKTTYGYGNLVYDCITQKWISFDIISGGGIKQFAVTEQPNNQKLYAIDDDNVYELYSKSAPYAQAIVRTKGFNSSTARTELKPSIVRGIFAQGTEDAVITVAEYVDGQKAATVKGRYNFNECGITLPAEFPLYYDSNKSVNNLIFNFTPLTAVGWKVSYAISWTGAAELSFLYLSATKEEKSLSLSQNV